MANIEQRVKKHSRQSENNTHLLGGPRKEPWVWTKAIFSNNGWEVMKYMNQQTGNECWAGKIKINSYRQCKQIAKAKIHSPYKETAIKLTDSSTAIGKHRKYGIMAAHSLERVTVT